MARTGRAASSQRRPVHARMRCSRACGNLLCDACAPKRVISRPAAHGTTVRLCGPCFDCAEGDEPTVSAHARRGRKMVMFTHQSLLPTRMPRS